MTKKLNAKGFKLPTKKPRADLPPEEVEAFAGTKPQARKTASSPTTKAQESASSQDLEPTASQSGEPASSQAPKPEASQDRKASSSRKKRRGASPQAPKLVRPRSGTGDQPYKRADGTATRSTTVHLEVSLHRDLRIRALEENRSMSDVVSSAVEAYLAKQG